MTYDILFSASSFKPFSNLAETSTIRVKSVGPPRRFYQWLSPLPIFNVDPQRTGTDPTMKSNIETWGGKGEFNFESMVWDKKSVS